MKTVSDLLRAADPMNDEAPRLSHARDRIRRTVIATASSGHEALGMRRLSRRRVLQISMGTAAAALVVGGLVAGVHDSTVQAAVRFEVRLAEADPAPGLVVARVADSRQLIYLHSESIVSNDDVAASWVTEGSGDRYQVSVEFLETGAERMRQATAAHVSRPVAILIDGEVVSAPVLRSEISHSALVDGNYTKADAERIVRGITIR